MTTMLDSYTVAVPDAFTLTDDYNTFIESLAGFFRSDTATRIAIIDPEIGNLYRFDLTGFLLLNNVPLEDHRLVMRVNGLNDVHDMDETKTSLLIPDTATISRMKQIYRTSLAVS